MKQSTHPEYREVLFIDSTTGQQFVCGSTLRCKDKAVFDKKLGGDGKEYPVYRAAVTSASHPFYTGKQNLGGAEGRIGRFNKRYGKQANTES